MTVWGYARISKTIQDPALQHTALLAAGVDPAHLVTDEMTGKRDDRPQLTWVLEQLQAGDELVVWKLDRLGRSLAHLVGLMDDLGRRGVQFRSLTNAIDTRTSGGRLMFHIIGAIAEFERELIVERTKAGLAVTTRPLGRPSTVNRFQFDLIQQLHAAGTSQVQIAATTGLSRAVVGRVIRGEIPSLAKFC